MSYRAWIVAVAFGLATLPSNAFSQIATEDQPRQEESAPNSEDAGDNEQTPPIDMTPALDRIESAIRDLIAEEDAVAAKAEQDRHQRDLNAQEGMALWAEYMFYATAATVLLTFAALVAIIRTLHHTRRAADIAEGMAKDTRVIGQAQVRAYVFCDSCTFKREDGSFEAVISVANVGQSPALQMFGEASLNMQIIGGFPEQPRCLTWVESNASSDLCDAIRSQGRGEFKFTFFRDLDFFGDEWKDDESARANFDDANFATIDARISWVDVFGANHHFNGTFDAVIAPNPYDTSVNRPVQSGEMFFRVHDPVSVGNG